MDYRYKVDYPLIARRIKAARKYAGREAPARTEERTRI